MARVPTMPNATLARVMPTWHTLKYSSRSFWMAATICARGSPWAMSSATRVGRILTTANSANTKNALRASRATSPMLSRVNSMVPQS